MLSIAFHAAWLLLLIPIGFFVLLFCVAMIEKRYTYPFAPIAPEKWDLLIVPPYVQRVCAGLEAAGFEFGSMVAHVKHPQIKIVGSVWRSPTRETVALVGSGNVLAAEAKQMWLFTPLGDGTYVVTTDQNDEGDPSGLYRVRRKLNVDVPTLLQFHQERLRRIWPDVRSFPEATPIEAVWGLYARRVAHMVSRGRAMWTHPEMRTWRHTAIGAFCVCLDFPKQLAGAMTQFWRVHGGGIAAATSPGHAEQFAHFLDDLRVARGDTSVTATAHSSPPHTNRSAQT